MPAEGTTSINALVPMFHVADVERSAAFYRLLGFEIGNYVPPTGRKEWAWLYSVNADDWKRGPNLMVTRSSNAVAAEAQEVSFYLYAKDLKSVWEVSGHWKDHARCRRTIELVRKVRRRLQWTMLRLHGLSDVQHHARQV